MYLIVDGKEVYGQNIQVLDTQEHIRLRPGMYIGDTAVKGVRHLFEGVVDGMARLDKSKLVKVNLCVQDLDYSISFQSVHVRDVTNHVRNIIGLGALTNGVFMFNVLGALSNSLNYLRDDETNQIDIKGTLDARIFQIPSIDFFVLSDRLKQFCYLHPKMHLTFTDGHDNKNVYHFPEGLKYLYNCLKLEAYLPLDGELSWSEEVMGMQVILHMADHRNLKGMHHYLFAENDKLSIPGSMFRGIVNGYIKGLNDAFRNLGVPRLVHHSDELLNHLLIVAQVKDHQHQIRFAGSVKEELDMPEFEKQLTEQFSIYVKQFYLKNEACLKKISNRYTG